MKRRQADLMMVDRVKAIRLQTFAAEVEQAVLLSAPPVNAQLTMVMGADGPTGEVREDPLVSAYVEGWHDAYVALQQFRRETLDDDAPGRTVGEVLDEIDGVDR